MKTRYKILMIGVATIAIIFLIFLSLPVVYELPLCGNLWPPAYSDYVPHCIYPDDWASVFVGMMYERTGYFLWDLGNDNRGIVYPGTGSMMMALQEKLCLSLNGTATNWMCLGVNDICENVKGDLVYNKELEQVGCLFHDRVDVHCTKKQLDDGWVAVDSYLCYEPFHDSILKSREKVDFIGKWMSSDAN